MNYIPVIFALSLGVMYIVIAVPPSWLSKVACVVLGLAILYFASRATQGVGATPSEDEPGSVEGDESLHRPDAEPDATADRPRE